jgi:hypothetical protein
LVPNCRHNMLRRWSNAMMKSTIGRRSLLTLLPCMVVVAGRHMVDESIIS